MERSLTHIALFSALIAVLGLIPPINLGFGVPISAQSLGVMLCGTVLGAKRGALSVLLFLALVALGLPLLSGGRGGLGVFQGPTAGFLVGFVPAAYVAGLIVEKTRVPLMWAAAFASFAGGVVVLYIFGIFGMSVVLDKTFSQSIEIVSVFLPGDVIKAFLAGLITHGIARARPGSLMSRD